MKTRENEAASLVQERILFVSTVKNEGPYLLEWLAYHRAIGFTDFLIYSNDCEDGSDLLLERLAQAGLIIHERNDVLRRGPHKSALKYALAHPAYAEADWVFVGDADEFVNVGIGGGLVTDLIATDPNADAFPITWRMFSNNGRTEVTDGMLSELTDAEPVEPEDGRPGRFVKTLFRRRDDVERLGIHGPVYTEGAQVAYSAPWLREAPDGDPQRPTRAFGYDVAQVNHYAVRTVDAYLLKRDRGRANHVNETLGMDYWTRWCLGGVKDRSIHRHLRTTDAGVTELKRDPVTRALHDAALEWHRERLAKILQDPQYARLKDDILASMGEAPAAPEKIDISASALALKAPKRHANRLAMLEKMPKGGVVAEIGVWNGDFSAAILEVCQPKSLTLIDPWDLLAGQASETWTHDKHEDAEAMRQMYASVTDRYAAYPEVAIQRGFSAEVLETYPDNHFDWVYIDGNHLYDFVRRDVEISFDKVRPGGCIAGDDFFWKRDGRLHVREAVFDVLRDKGLSGIHERMGQQFMIWLPK